MKFSDYVHLASEKPELTETAVERFLRIIKDSEVESEFPISGYEAFREGRFKIHGLREVIDHFAHGAVSAVEAYKRGQTLLFVITGPSGSGKTEFGKKLEDLLVEDVLRNPRYTFNLNGIPCPFGEDPINLLASRLSLVPPSIRQQFDKPGRPQLCPACVPKYNDAIAEAFEQGEINLDEFCRFLDDIVEVRLLPPRIASADISDESFRRNLVRILKNCNRGLLQIDVNDCKLDGVPAENYQALLKLGDGRIIQNNGTSINPDLLVVMYSNWLKEDVERKKPFSDRAYVTNMRWNLSQREERKLYAEAHLPFSHFNARGLEGLALAVVGSRINEDVSKRGSSSESDLKALSRLVHLYDMFEEGNRAMIDIEVNEVLERLKGDKSDGRKEGYSVRQALKEITGIKPKEGDCVSPQDAIRLIESRKQEFGACASDAAKRYITNRCVSDIVLAYIYIKNQVSSRTQLGEIDRMFNSYYEIFVGSFISRSEYVSYGGKRIPPGEALADIESKLGVTKGKSADFREAIQRFMDQTMPKRLPSFMEILEMDRSIITSTLKETDYLPWEKIKKGDPMTAEETGRIGKFRGFLNEMGYCNICADNALLIAAANR